MPKPLIDILKKLYRFFKRAFKMERRAAPFIDGIWRNWDLQLNIPRDYRNRFISSIVGGTLDFDIKGDNKNVLLCAQPKSASLYFTEVLARVLNYQNHQIGFMLQGGAIYYPRLLAAKFSGSNTISHCHNAADSNTIAMIRKLNIRTIVLTRNLLDSIVSRRDMLEQDKRAGNIASPSAINRFLNASLETQLDVIIDFFAASYINFVTSWNLYKNDECISPIFITYEQINLDQVASVSRVANNLGEEVNPEDISRVVSDLMAQGGINFNKGIIGRGKKIITDRQIEKLRHLALSLGCNDEEFLGFDLK